MKTIIKPLPGECRAPAQSLFQKLSPAETRRARAIAYEAALAVIG